MITSKPERPIDSSSEDSMGRGSFVERLTATLIDPKSRKSTGIVVGVTGEWGSGKSSILNLVAEKVKVDFPDALIVRFDPWLISGRNDLISEFFKELVGTIKSEPKAARHFKAIAGLFAEYGAHLAPIGNFIKPGFGSIAAGIFNAAKSHFSHSKSLSALRSELLKEIERVSAPIIILIDEMDRVEDDEVRAIAQLVRSVADFPSISYVLAYDTPRVVQALGSSETDSTLKIDRGRAYLEKIVQIQIPLPVTLENETENFIKSELLTLADLDLPVAFYSIERYSTLVEMLSSEIIRTPRDVKRLIGAFHALGGMVRAEVDWIDLLAYCALMVKAPLTIERVKRDPDYYTEDPQSLRATRRHTEMREMTLDEKLSELIPNSENKDGTRQILGFIFPALANEFNRQPEHTDALCLHRQLLTTLRLGLLPGSVSRKNIEDIFLKPSAAVAELLKTAYDDDKIVNLIDRIDDLYGDITAPNKLPFWQGAAAFCKKDDGEWMSYYHPMHNIIRNLAGILERAISKSSADTNDAATIFFNLLQDGDEELTPLWLRSHIFAHGLFGSSDRSHKTAFLNIDQTKKLALDLSARWRTQHLEGKLIPYRWDLQPVYTMVDTGAWDDACREALDETLNQDNALIGLTLMLYGSYFTTGRDTIKAMCNYDHFIDRLRSIEDSVTERHETVKVAIKKALTGGW